MIVPHTNSERLLYSTVHILGDNSTGTGFLYDYPIGEGNSLALLVTNKHVISGLSGAKLIFHTSIEVNGEEIPTQQFYSIGMSSLARYWIDHPDQEVDLCALPLNVIINIAQAQGAKIFACPLTSSMIMSDQELVDELRALEKVVMIGYPNGLSIEEHNYPILLSGNTASHPGIDVEVIDNGQNNGMVNIPTYPGSSDSPVLIVDEGFYISKTGQFLQQDRLIFLGVLHSGPDIFVPGEFKVGNLQARFAAAVPMNIGCYVKAKEVEVLAQFAENKLRQKGKSKNRSF